MEELVSIEIIKGRKKYIISKSPRKGKIWIETKDSEGGDFDIELFFDVVDDFYKENF